MVNKRALLQRRVNSTAMVFYVCRVCSFEQWESNAKNMSGTSSMNRLLSFRIVLKMLSMEKLAEIDPKYIYIRLVLVIYNGVGGGPLKSHTRINSMPHECFLVTYWPSQVYAILLLMCVFIISILNSSTVVSLAHGSCSLPALNIHFHPLILEIRLYIFQLFLYHNERCRM